MVNFVDIFKTLFSAFELFSHVSEVEMCHEKDFFSLCCLFAGTGLLNARNCHTNGSQNSAKDQQPLPSKSTFTLNERKNPEKWVKVGEKEILEDR